MPKNIACVGNVTRDYLLSVDTLPELDDVGYVNERNICMGGRGGLVAVTLGRLGAQVGLVTMLPDIPETSQYRGWLEQQGVNTSGISVDANAERFHEVFVALSTADRNCISFFSPGDVGFNATAPLQRAQVSEAQVAYFSTHKRRFNQELLDGVDPSRTQVIHNLSSYLTGDAAYRQQMMATSSHLIGNDLETGSFLELEGIIDPNALFDRYPTLSAYIHTRGEDGSTVYQRDVTAETYGVVPCEVRAPVGAGDAFAAGVAYGVSEGWPMSESIPLAARLAALSVSSHTSYPDLALIPTMLEA